MNEKKICLNNKSIIPPETICAQAGAMQIGAAQIGAMPSQKFDSRCNTDKQREHLIDKLKRCYSEDEIDRLFDDEGIEDYAARAAILRECMDAVYILSAGVPDPALEGMSKEELAKAEYEIEKSTFLDGYWR